VARRSTRIFAWVTVAQAILHFSSSSAYALTQNIEPVFFVDFVSIGLLLLTVVGLLRWSWGLGPLCGAWGFEFCLYCRAVLQRVGSLCAEVPVDHRQLLTEVYALSVWLTLVAIAFTFSVVLCIRSARSRNTDSPTDH
jgi:hypothetical protein